MAAPSSPRDPARPAAALLDTQLSDPGPPEVCPGCGAVLAAVAGDEVIHPGASPSCARLFEVTLRGLREEAATDGGAAATCRLADAAYDAQHPALAATGIPPALARLADELGAPEVAGRTEPPSAWTTTIADVAADLDVIDLGVLVESWARAVLDDWASADDHGTR